MWPEGTTNILQQLFYYYHYYPRALQLWGALFPLIYIHNNNNWLAFNRIDNALQQEDLLYPRH